MSIQNTQINSNPTERRDRMWEHGSRMLALINGGGAVALLAFIQSIWTNTPNLVFWVAIGLVSFAIGAMLAALIPIYREKTVLFWKKSNKKARKYQIQYRCLANCSAVFFFLGIMVIAIPVMKMSCENQNVNIKLPEYLYEQLKINALKEDKLIIPYIKSEIIKGLEGKGYKFSDKKE